MKLQPCLWSYRLPTESLIQSSITPATDCDPIFNILITKNHYAINPIWCKNCLILVKQSSVKSLWFSSHRTDIRIWTACSQCRVPSASTLPYYVPLKIVHMCNDNNMAKVIKNSFQIKIFFKELPNIYSSAEYLTVARSSWDDTGVSIRIPFREVTLWTYTYSCWGQNTQQFPVSPHTFTELLEVFTVTMWLLSEPIIIIIII